MNTQALQTLLASSRLVQHFYCYDEIDSTMDQARRLIKAATNISALHGTLILADGQTAGRGRHGRPWSTPAGSAILATIILSRQALPQTDDRSRQLSLVAAALPVAICRGINTIIRAARIKYPNDIVCDDRKLGGVLIESTGDAVLAGFGINCAQEIADFPSDLKMPATSTFLETGKHPSREDLVANIIAELELMLNPTNFLTAGESMRELCDTLGREILLDLGPHGIVQGTAETITPDGILKLQTASGVKDIHTTQVVRTWSADAEALS